YGGSSLAITLGAVGILVNVSTQNEKVGWFRHASIDLGRRNGRTLVPGDRRRAGAVAERTLHPDPLCRAAGWHGGASRAALWHPAANDRRRQARHGEALAQLVVSLGCP